MWDVFISHASEDKEPFVRLLVKELSKYGVAVWYDEFSLELGDSLSASIDKGLMDSKYGLVVLSPAFFEKKWTNYEYRSLLAKEFSNGKTILPIWHNVDYDYVASKNLHLADIKALSSSIGLSKLAFEIIRVIRPDIISSYLTISAFRQLKVQGHAEEISIKHLLISDQVRHTSLPKHLVIASRMFSALFPFNGFEDIIKDFQKDADYDEEFVIWTIISCAYIDVFNKGPMLFVNEDFKSNLLLYLLSISMGDEKKSQDIPLDDDVKFFAAHSYLEHAKVLFPIIRSN